MSGWFQDVCLLLGRATTLTKLAKRAEKWHGHCNDCARNASARVPGNCVADIDGTDGIAVLMLLSSDMGCRSRQGSARVGKVESSLQVHGLVLAGRL